ncbi:PIN domain-containing protein [Ectobacillus ponti]|uniref:PIN domain-containing protein n=1 Tax=Ectobacillus ponti TaxID=2961894 RepID=A0AA41X8D7_9BACI|nr:PIN domain-containing protein [Ectobacillus ponti]MCP8970627.1 PIN domain-containing protein [Ectobacillus ponti]
MIIDGIDLSHHYIILDASALMDKKFQRFLRTKLVESYNETLRSKQEKDFRIFIPEAVLMEMERISKRPGSVNLQRRTDALDGIEMAKSLAKANYAEMMRSDYTGTIRGFNDVSLLSIFVELRRHTHVALLTNDRGLATDVMNLNLLKSVESKFAVKALQVNWTTGQLKEWILDPERREAKRFPSEVLR